MKLLSNIPTLPQSMTRVVNRANESVVVFYFWSQNCSFCKRWPEFVEKLKAVFGDKVCPIVVHVGPLSSSQFEMANEMHSFIDPDEQIAKQFFVKSFPTIFVFDKNRKLRFQQAGSAENRLLMNRLQKFIEQ